MRGMATSGLSAVRWLEATRALGDVLGIVADPLEVAGDA